MQADTKSASNLQHGSKTRVAVLAKCLVQALPAEPGIAGDLSHAASACDIAKSASDTRGIVGGLFEPGLKVRSPLFGCTKLFGYVIGHGLGLGGRSQRLRACR